MDDELKNLTTPRGSFPATPMDAGALADADVDAPLADASNLQFIPSEHLDVVLAAYETAALKAGMGADLIAKGVAFLKTVTPLVAGVLLPGSGALVAQVVNAIPTL